MEGRPHTWLRLPDSVEEEMEEHTPLDMRLQPDDCANGPTWVVMELNSLGFMFLRRGWKSFDLGQGLQEGHFIHFNFDGVAKLFMKAFRNAGGRLGCCMEGDSCVRNNSSGNNDSSNSSCEVSGGNRNPYGSRDAHA
ncbi:l-ascorbate oxidase-like protein [Hordeum vulgare]|nr:l-ascorbate oxidase-like protein [Hordeum vulgare]